MKTVVIIPARGGSKGIPGKNIRHLAGKPLISYPISAALQSNRVSSVVVSTDCTQIGHIAELSGAQVLMRPDHLAKDSVPLDPVVHHAVEHLEDEAGSAFDIVITIQATSPLLSTQTIDAAIQRFIASQADTMLSVVDERHLSWTQKDGKYVPNYTKRVNRQYLPPHYIETGGILLTRRKHVTAESRFGSEIDLIEVPKHEAIDIDVETDWWIAEKFLQRRKVLFRVDGDNEMGMGHIYRTLQLAFRLIDHEVCFLTSADKETGYSKLIESNFNIRAFSTEQEMWEHIKDYDPHIVINDILDTDVSYIEKLKNQGRYSVNFEDLGHGAALADIVINALYDEKFKLHNHFWGKDYYCLKDEFHITRPPAISETVSQILITFGGTDPNNYTLRILKLLEEMKISAEVEVILGLGYADQSALEKEIASFTTPIILHRNVDSMSKHMLKADLIFTSAGRTVYEIASLGIPAIVLAQNNRELHHTFASPENGVVNLRLGYEVSDQEITDTIREMMAHPEIRRQNHDLMLKTNLRNGITNVLNTIFSNYRKWEHHYE